MNAVNRGGLALMLLGIGVLLMPWQVSGLDAGAVGVLVVGFIGLIWGE